MSNLKDLGKQLGFGTGIALATTGLSTCTNNGAVDPAPPPLDCSAPGVANGAMLQASGTSSGNTANININSYNTNGTFADDVGVSGLNGLTLTSLSPSPPNGSQLDVVLVFTGTSTGSFTLGGSLTDFRGTRCAFSRTFTITKQENGILTIAQRDSVKDQLPLSERHAARIEVRRREGSQLELEAVTAHRGEHLYEWTVSAGTVVESTGGRLVWELPCEPGLYQVEVVVRYGADGTAGFAHNALAFEVGV